LRVVKSLAEFKTDKMRYVTRSDVMPFREWIDRAQIYLRGKRYSTDKHEYLDQILSDSHPDQTFEKSAQVGISTLVLMKSLYVAEHLGKKAIYFFQDDSAVSDFSNDRCQPMIEASPYLSRIATGISNVSLKQIGPGSLYFRGLFSKGKAKSVDADAIFLDELDEAKKDNIQFAMDRLLHSDLQWVHALSQPSFPGEGIDERFVASDQHYWMLKCPGCGEYNQLEMDFPQNFIPISEKQKKSFHEKAKYYRGCKRCHTRLDMKAGEWVARYPSRAKRGYHLSYLYTQVYPKSLPSIATKIMAEYEDSRRSQSKLARFTISVIGYPYAGGNVRITDTLLDECEGDYGFETSAVGAFMGVDQGDMLSVAIGILSRDVIKFIYFEETQVWGRLEYLMQCFGVMKCVIDAMPNKHSAKTFASRFPNRVSIQYFGGRVLKIDKELLENRIPVDTVHVDRTDSLDSMQDRMEGGYLQLPSRRLCEGNGLARVEDARRHLKALVSRVEENTHGQLKRVYVSGNSVENHYGMAMNSACIAAFELGRHGAPTMVVPIFGGRYSKRSTTTWE
jgi:hypothetical protein